MSGPPRSAAGSGSAARRDSSSDSAAGGSSTRATTSIGFARAPPDVAARLEAAGVPSISVSRGFFSGFGSDGEDSDDDDGFMGFMDAVRNSRAFSFSGLPVTMHTPHPPPPARSFASNVHDASAGGSADNALEIEDSDDDEVEIVGSSSSTNRPPRGARGM